MRTGEASRLVPSAARVNVVPGAAVPVLLVLEPALVDPTWESAAARAASTLQVARIRPPPTDLSVRATIEDACALQGVLVVAVCGEGRGSPPAASTEALDARASAVTEVLWSLSHPRAASLPVYSLWLDRDRRRFFVRSAASGARYAPVGAAAWLSHLVDLARGQRSPRSLS